MACPGPETFAHFGRLQILWGSELAKKAVIQSEYACEVVFVTFRRTKRNWIGSLRKLVEHFVEDF